MANAYELEIQAQPGIYSPKERTMMMYFAEPENGVNEDTGILLILAGYAGSATSHVYEKMRKEFADQYNLLTVQCDYFGYEFMQGYPTDITEEMWRGQLSPAELDLLSRDYEKYSHILKGKVFKQYLKLGESKECFNDMGLMQAMDNIRAIKVLLDIIQDNHYKINYNRVYAYGFSHGAYLAYLCNAFWPDFFTEIIDNSAYLFPYYWNKERIVSYIEEGMCIDQMYNYKAKEFVDDEEILDLKVLYKNFDNHAQIICYAGEDDFMTPLEEKKAFLNDVENAKVETITKTRVDMIHVKSTGHGLGADFLELFDATYKAYILPKEEKEKSNRKAGKKEFSFSNAVYDTTAFHYEINWEDGVPVLSRERK